MAKIFLCHANEDKPQVREVYQRLKVEGFEPWLDEEDLLPGQLWDQEIRLVLRESDFILIFFSQNSVAKRGYVQREMKLALDAWEEVPEGQIHTIPVRLNDCKIPKQFQRFQRADLFGENGYDKLVEGLRAGLKQRQSTNPRLEIVKSEKRRTNTEDPTNTILDIQMRIHIDGGTFFTVELNNEFFLGNKRYYLRIRADIKDDTFLQDFVCTSKISSVEDIRLLMTINLPGLSLNQVYDLPTELPPHSDDCIDFEILVNSNIDLWKRIEQNGNLAVYCSLPPETEMRLLAVPIS